MTTRARRRRGGARRARPVAEVAPDAPPATPPSVSPPEVPLAVPERAFAARVPPAKPDRPLPMSRRAIFLDVENTSRAEHIARTIDHLDIDRRSRRTEFVAVGNWRVIGSDTARLLARHGAQLVHSAPSTGVRDWSDLRIAVSAGVWLAAARPGDSLEIVSEDRAFDAVGDVAAALGIVFRRLSYRVLAGAPLPEPVHEVEAPGPHGRRGRRRHRGGGARPAPTLLAAEARPHPPRPPEPRHHERPQPEVARTDGEPHTAPHDEIIGVVRELVERASDGAVLIDTLANALKSRGFRRTPGSPRLITRLRRIKELSVSPTGMITMVARPLDGGEPPVAEDMAVGLVEPGGVAAESSGVAPEGGPRRRRRSRRRGRRRRSAVAPLAGA